MITPEGKVKQKIKKILDEFDAYYFFPPANGYGRAGIPDVVACFKGCFIAIEAKAGHNKATALQLRELELVKDAGGLAMVCYEDDLPTLRRYLEGLRDGSKNSRAKAA